MTAGLLFCLLLNLQEGSGATKSPTVKPKSGFSVADVQVVEVDAKSADSRRGSVLIAVGVTLAPGIDAPTSVDFATADNTAVAGKSRTATADYVARRGTLSFPPTSTYQQFKLRIWGDDLDEGDNALAAAETFFVNLGSPVGAEIADGQGVVRIIDND
jgi:hypothetical protein